MRFGIKEWFSVVTIATLLSGCAAPASTSSIPESAPQKPNNTNPIEPRKNNSPYPIPEKTDHPEPTGIPNTPKTPNIPPTPKAAELPQEPEPSCVKNPIMGPNFESFGVIGQGDHLVTIVGNECPNQGFVFGSNGDGQYAQDKIREIKQKPIEILNLENKLVSNVFAPNPNGRHLDGSGMAYFGNDGLLAATVEFGVDDSGSVVSIATRGEIPGEIKVIDTADGTKKVAVFIPNETTFELMAVNTFSVRDLPIGVCNRNDLAGTCFPVQPQSRNPDNSKFAHADRFSTRAYMNAGFSSEEARGAVRANRKTTGAYVFPA